MSIRNKLVVFSVGAIIFAVVCIGLIAAWQFNSYALHSFEQQAILEIKRIDTVLSQYVNNGRRSAERLIKDPLLTGGVGKFASYAQTTKETTLLFAEHNPYEQQVYNLFMAAREMEPSFGLVFMGAVDGGFAQAPEKDILGPGYDPRQRPWYKDALANPEDINVSKVYQSSSGALVTSVTGRIKAPDGSLAGILAIDLDLSMLSRYIRDLKIGKAGYAMVFDKDSTILMDPKDNANTPRTFFKKISKDVLPTLEPVTAMASGFTTAVVNGEKMNIAVYTSAALGWKVAALIPTAEVHQVSNNMVYMITILGIAICLVCGVVMLLVARSITRPIGLVVDAAGAIAGGNFNALPPAQFFSGEMLHLHASLTAMVKDLAQLVSTTEAKSKEAEEQSKKAALAVTEAEQARHEAERAKREGMLHAARQLEEIVGQTRHAAEEMGQSISKAAQGATTQRKHAEETTAAMEAMSDTVVEVARSSAQASDTAVETTAKAETGAGMVSAVKDAISDVSRKTLELKDVINNLGEQAHGIDQIITVINDIADQTNLLALNAAIEAARAGEAGRGFAVVADEVRKLAEKTMTATKEVGDSVKSIQAGTQKSVQGMDGAASSVTKSTELASEAESAIREIVHLSTDTAERVHSITTAGERQSAASATISHLTDMINGIASETADRMNSANKAVAVLEDLILKLENLTKGLKNS